MSEPYADPAYLAVAIRKAEVCRQMIASGEVLKVAMGEMMLVAWEAEIVRCSPTLH